MKTEIEITCETVKTALVKALHEQIQRILEFKYGSSTNTEAIKELADILRTIQDVDLNKKEPKQQCGEQLKKVVLTNES